MRSTTPIFAITAWLVSVWASTAGAVDPLPKAHAHNDYHHDRPLLDALDQGFCSVEADVFLIENKLLVAHDPTELRAERTLQRLYLDPLRERFVKNNGRIYPNGPRFTLLVDIKFDGAKTYVKLDEVLANYSQLLTSVIDGVHTQGAIDVIVSGDRPKKEILEDRSRFVGIDGRLSDLDSDVPAHLMPLISDRWTSHFKWRGKAAFPEPERTRLLQIVEKAHRAGRRVRFWATPESRAIWEELLAADVDHINTDKLKELAEFLRRR
ncbi:MAG: phosphatidylinositol-specific phospholipase C/glycerophosphodiester phosphodiesterase family protein [Planctomycetota bacterium]